MADEAYEQRGGPSSGSGICQHLPLVARIVVCRAAGMRAAPGAGRPAGSWRSRNGKLVRHAATLLLAAVRLLAGWLCAPPSAPSSTKHCALSSCVAAWALWSLPCAFCCALLPQGVHLSWKPPKPLISQLSSASCRNAGGMPRQTRGAKRPHPGEATQHRYWRVRVAWARSVGGM